MSGASRSRAGCESKGIDSCREVDDSKIVEDEMSRPWSNIMRGEAKVLLVPTTLAVLFATSAANAWIFPEHTEITTRAYKETVLTQATPAELGVLGAVIDALDLCGTTPSKCGSGCPTLAVLPSLAGDHSCSPAELLGMVQGYATPKGAWVKDVLAVADETEKNLASAGTDGDDREDVRRGMHIALQGADARYVERALLDFSHFQLARESGRLDDLVGYAHFAVGPARQANATAAYINYHVAAIRQIGRAHV